MKKLTTAIIILLVLLSSCTTAAPKNTAAISASNTQSTSNTHTPIPTTATLKPTVTVEPTPEAPKEDSIAIVVPHWIILELTEPIVEEFVYFKSEYRLIDKNETSNTYYIDKDDYKNRLENLNPPDYALVLSVYPEDYTLVDIIDINEEGDIVNVTVVDKSFFTTFERGRIENLLYQCALSKCIMGIDQDDISIEVNYTILDSSEKISTSIPLRINSVVDTTDDMLHEFKIHIPLQYTMGEPELTKQQLITAGVEDIIINKDGTLDYIATKELILKMGNDYMSMMEGIFQNITNEVDYITKIYCDSLNTTIVIEVDFETYDIDHLISVQSFFNNNTQYHQLFSGVKVDDIQFKIVSIDNEYRDKILELSYPPLGE